MWQAVFCSPYLLRRQILGNQIDQHIRALVHKLGALVSDWARHDIAHFLQTIADGVLFVLVLVDLVEFRDGILAQDTFLVGHMLTWVRLAEFDGITHLDEDEKV